jgi:hypothetical protein
MPRHSATAHVRGNGIKWCPRCASFRMTEAFGLDINRTDGLSGWCRVCRATNEKARRDSSPIAANTANRARYHANPEQWHAKVAVARAVLKGLLSKPAICPTCKRDRKVEAHHHLGYARKNWLNVRWMCRQCHVLEHKRGPVAA